MPPRATLSAAIITYNEEHNIRACLDSLDSLVDEIVVLDSFSSDATAEICRQHPKVVFRQHPFDGHVQQKNRAVDLCSSEWVLSLDADERVSPQLRRSIEEFLGRNPQAAGAKFARLTYHLRKHIRHSGWYPNARYRLFRKGQAHWGGVNPHDRLILKGRGVRLRGDLLHFSVKDLSDQVRNINSFTSIAALERYNRGASFSLLRLVFRPPAAFLTTYLWKLGILDGMQGFILAFCAAVYVFLREAKLYELDRLGSGRPSNLPERHTLETPAAPPAPRDG